MFLFSAVEQERAILEALESDEQQLTSSAAASSSAATSSGHAGADSSGGALSATQPHLQQILASMTSSSQRRVAERVLSSDAQRVVDALPDCSFMRANVLMFPLGGSSGVSSGDG